MNSDIQSGTILEVDHTWRQGGLQLRINRVDLIANLPDVNVSGVNIERFALTNRKGKAIVYSYGQENFSATDNLGNNLKINRVCMNNFTKALGVIIPKDKVLENGKTEDVPEDCSLFITADITDPTLKEIIVKVTGISSITDARWRIPIEH